MSGSKGACFSSTDETPAGGHQSSLRSFFVVSSRKKRPLSNVLCDSKKKHSTKARAPAVSLKKQRTTTTQLYLDFGQRDFAKRIFCATCGMPYDAGGTKDDLYQHARVCKEYLEGVPFLVKEARIVSKTERRLNSAIIEVWK
jgi:hypothetical protein